MKGPYSVWLSESANVAALEQLGLKFEPATQGGGTSIQSTATAYPASLVPRKETTVTADAVIPAFNGDHYIRVQTSSIGPVAITLTLPTLAASKPGNRLIIYRIPGVGFLEPPNYVAVNIVAAAAPDLVNGFAGNNAGRLSLQGQRHLIILERTPSAWVAMSSDEAGTTSQLGLVEDTDLEPWSGLKVFNVTEDTTPITIRLPDSDLVPDGSRALFRAMVIGGHVIVPAAGETINGLPEIYLGIDRPLELVAVRGGWQSIGPTPTALVESTLLAAGQVEPLHGIDRLVRLSFLVDADVTLPALADADVGSRITFVRETGAGIPTIVTDDPATEVNGITTAAFTPYVLRSLQDSVSYLRVAEGWVRDQSDTSTAPISSAADPLNIAAWVGQPLFVTSTAAGVGHTINLPAASTVAYGATLVLFNDSADPASITANGADTINTAGTLALAANTTAIVMQQSATTWIAVISA
jgi:hypothetical protein